MYIYIRHAECVTNADKTLAVNSNDDDVLTPAGIRQAQITGQFLNQCKLGNCRVAASPLARSKQTAEIICAEIGFRGEIQYSDLLIEKGSLEGYAEAFGRYRLFVESLQYGSGGPLLVVTHLHMLQAIFGSYLGIVRPEILNFRNGSISVLEDTKILTLNSFLHLLDFTYDAQFRFQKHQ